MSYIYGPVPSRRLGLSLGISPIPPKTCNYSCIYCQLGRTSRMTNIRQDFFPLEDILEELDPFLLNSPPFDVVTIVGEGEPTLYLDLGALIKAIKERVKVPVAVITNGALLYDPGLRSELMEADLVLPSLDAWDEESFRAIHRPHKRLSFSLVLEGLIRFSKEYQGQIWMETMLMEGINDGGPALAKLSAILKKIRHDRLYVNTPVRPPAEAGILPLSSKRMEEAAAFLGGTAIDLLASEGFYSDIEDDRQAVLNIIGRHPMNQHEIESFLKSRGREDPGKVLLDLEEDPQVSVIDYRGYRTYRIKN